jgi:hypothetical protein
VTKFKTLTPCMFLRSNAKLCEIAQQQKIANFTSINLYKGREWYKGNSILFLKDFFSYRQSCMTKVISPNIWYTRGHVVQLRVGARVAQWVRSLDLTAHSSLSPIRRGFSPSFLNYKKGALDSQPLYLNLDIFVF